jgi:hypothetical protein
MKDKKEHSNTRPGSPTTNPNRTGFYSAIFTAIITVITFGLAITALPNSGPGCLEDCFEYPYLDSLSQFPIDYWWMIPALLMILSYMILMVSIHALAPQAKKIFSQIGLAFAVMAALLLLSDYYLQFSVVPISLMSGETEGIALLTQYNPHGIFIALEELGYLLMSLSFLFIAPVFSSHNRLETAISWIFSLGFVLTIVALVTISMIYGLDRSYRFEIAAISIDWLVLIVNGILLSVVFRRGMKENRES